MQLEAQKNKMMKSAISMRISITLITAGIATQFLHCYLLYITPEKQKNHHEPLKECVNYTKWDHSTNFAPVWVFFFFHLNICRKKNHGCINLSIIYLEIWLQWIWGCLQTLHAVSDLQNQGKSWCLSGPDSETTSSSANGIVFIILINFLISEGTAS